MNYTFYYDETFEKKIKDFQKKIKENPNNIRLHYEFTKLIATSTSKKYDTLGCDIIETVLKKCRNPYMKNKFYINEAKIMLKEEQYHSAERLLKKVFLKYDNYQSYEALYWLGILKINTLEFNQAKEAFETCLFSNNNQIIKDSYFRLIHIAMEYKNYDQALDYAYYLLENQEKLKVSQFNIYKHLAMIHRKKGEYAIAKNYLDCIQTKQMETNINMDTHIKMEYNHILRDSGKIDEAISGYEECIYSNSNLIKMDAAFELMRLDSENREIYNYIFRKARKKEKQKRK